MTAVLYAGSSAVAPPVPFALGYVLVPDPAPQSNDMESVASLMLSPTLIPCCPIVRERTPEVGSYEPPVGV